jgi:hypothetical protein
MLTRHELTCQRHGCGRRFTARRSDAKFCSRSCRRRGMTSPAPPVDARPGPRTPDEAPAVAEEEDLDGWRRVGPWLIPPPDPTNTWHFGP